MRSEKRSLNAMFAAEREILRSKMLSTSSAEANKSDALIFGGLRAGGHDVLGKRAERPLERNYEFRFESSCDTIARLQIDPLIVSCRKAANHGVCAAIRERNMFREEIKRAPIT